MAESYEDEYVEIGKNDYRNLPQYQKFRVKKEKPESTEFGKNYHLLSSVRSSEQQTVEGTVRKQKLIRAAFMVLYAVISIIIHLVLLRVFPNAGETGELIISCFAAAAGLLWVNAALMAIGTLQGPVTIKDVQKYDGKIQQALRDLETHDRKRALVDSHPKRKGASKNRKP